MRRLNVETSADARAAAEWVLEKSKTENVKLTVRTSLTTGRTSVQIDALGIIEGHHQSAAFLARVADELWDRE